VREEYNFEEGKKNPYVNKIVYFELNNFEKNDCLSQEPFKTWIEDLDKYLHNEEWIKENKLCVMEDIVNGDDVLKFNCTPSLSFCISTTEEWVKDNCPKLLTECRDLLRFADEDGIVRNKYDSLCWFLEYKEENIGLKWSFENAYTVDEDIVKAAKVKATVKMGIPGMGNKTVTKNLNKSVQNCTEVKMGIPGMGTAKKLIKEYYLN